MEKLFHNNNSSADQQQQPMIPKLTLNLWILLHRLLRPFHIFHWQAKMPRKKLPPFFLSRTPVKEALEQKKKGLEKKRKNRRHRKDWLGRQTKRKEKENTALIQFFFSSSEDELPYPIPYSDNDMTLKEEDHCCILRGEKGKTELWYQCFKWAIMISLFPKIVR